MATESLIAVILVTLVMLGLSIYATRRGKDDENK